MQDAFEKLQKILALEVKREFDDRAVFGGLGKLATTWEQDAQKEKKADDGIRAIIEILKKYSVTPIEQRHQLISQIKDLLQNSNDLETLPLKYSSNSATTHKKRIAEEKQQKLETPPSIKSNISAKKMLNLETTSALTSIPSIGKSREKMLQEANIFSIEDLLYHFPRKYNDYSKLSTINQLEFGDQVTIIATVKSISARTGKNHKIQITEVVIEDGSGSMRLSFFNQPYLQFQIKKEMRLSIKGKVDMYLGRFTLNSPEWDILDGDFDSIQGISPIYRLPVGFSQKTFHKIIQNTLEIWGNQIQDYLPTNSYLTPGLMDLQKAIRTLHQPKDLETVQAAMERLSFDQIFFLQMGVLAQKKAWNQKQADQYLVTDSYQNTLTGFIPFPLTNSQLKTLNAIKKDLASGSPMNRLLQGDVGSGKTIVALLAAAFVFTNKDAQCTIMAPTGILAEQHYKNALNFFNENKLLSPPQIRLLVGDTPESEKEVIRKELQSGEIKLLIGTHSLIEDPITFKNLQLAVIDEQHRFGVDQRKRLSEKGPRAHLLAMTATPIPRSLALTIYGDLDLSVMNEMPPGRQEILTHIISPKDRDHIYKLIKEKVLRDQQAFIVYPYVELDEEDQQKIAFGAVNEFKRLKSKIFPGLNLALLHGRMKPAEKESVMNKFHQGHYNILVSTTVIEVGVDVPNASVMVIEGANRFGLAQLHQLRGRIGRGSHQSVCFLIPETEDSLANERLTALQKTNDGFKLADIDLQQRGPGDFLGYRQSGFKDLTLQNIMNVELIEKARSYAESVFEDDPYLQNVEHIEMKKKLTYFWNELIGDLNLYD